MKEHTTSFNFDEWMKLAKDDPEAFEKQRLEAIQGVISNSSDNSKNRLEGLQWQIDQMRKTSATPMAACLDISKMMWENVQGEEGLVETLNQLTGKTPIKQKVVKRAEVVQLRAGSPTTSEKTG